MIIDTSALIAILRDEPEAATCAEAIEAAPHRRISAANFVEGAIVIDGSRDPVASRRFDDLVKEAQLVIEAVTEVQARIAREAYRDFGRGSGHPARLNFGDCFAYALACATGEPLLVQGRRFRTHRRRASATRNSITHHHSWTGQWKGQQATDLASSARKGRGRFLCLLILVFDGAAIGAGRGDGDAPYRVDDDHVLFGYVFQCLTARRNA
jgi:ribonuclease VapC